MNKTILCISADNKGNKLFIKNLQEKKNQMFVQYKSTLNDIPFQETELFLVDDNCVITGDDGTILWRFSKKWLEKLI